MKDIEVAVVLIVGLLSTNSGQSSCLGSLPVTCVRVTVYITIGRWNLGGIGLQEMMANMDVSNDKRIIDGPCSAAYIKCLQL